MQNSDYGVIFDMDGVIVDTAHAHYESWLRAAQRRGVEISWETFQQSFGRPNAETIPEMFGEDVSAGEIERIDREKEEAFRRIFRDKIEPVPGVVELVNELHRQGFRLAVGSSAPPENIEMVLDELGLRGCFAGYVAADDVERGKPAPDVFLQAAAVIAVPPERCLVLEDTPPGIRAAKNAGMACLAVSTSRPAEDLAEAERVVESLAEVGVSDVVQLLRGG